MPPKESTLHSSLRETLKTHSVTMMRVETRVALGLPDCLVALPCGQWITLELKVVSSGRKIRLSPHQIAFHTRYAHMPSWILVQYWPPGTTRSPDSILLLYRAPQARAVSETGIDTPPVLRARWRDVDWPAVITLLACPPTD